MKSKLPAEEEDQWRRPEFIATNDGGATVCENRLSCASLFSLFRPLGIPLELTSLFSSLQISSLRAPSFGRANDSVRGSASTSRVRFSLFLCFSPFRTDSSLHPDPHDSIFTAHLYVSDSEELYRYTDEGTYSLPFRPPSY
jgi:hypothetical protein